MVLQECSWLLSRQDMLQMPCISSSRSSSNNSQSTILHNRLQCRAGYSQQGLEALAEASGKAEDIGQSALC